MGGSRWLMGSIGNIPGNVGVLSKLLKELMSTIERLRSVYVSLDCIDYSHILYLGTQSRKSVSNNRVGDKLT